MSNTNTATKPQSLSAWVDEIHALAVEKGWWDGERDADTAIALIHSEWSEALEAYRDKMPLLCMNGADNISKPEGIAIELIDGCIRVFDFLGGTGFMVDVAAGIETLISEVHESKVIPVEKWKLPKLVKELHFVTGMYDKAGDIALLSAAGMAFAWIEVKGLNPEEIMRQKHEYNKTRPYRHGGKVC